MAMLQVTSKGWKRDYLFATSTMMRKKSRVSSWLVLLLALAAGPVDDTADAFCPSQVHLHSKHIVSALHVSKKNKKGLANAAAVKEAAQVAARRELHRALSAEQERLMGTPSTKPATVAKTVRNLLHAAKQRDGLHDIGDESRLLAVACYNAAGRYGDTLDLLSAISDETIFHHDTAAAWIGLQANGATEKWHDAVAFANLLFDSDESFFLLDAEALRLAIRSYANANVNMEKAIQLLKNGSHHVMPEDYNVVLRSLQQSNQAQEAVDLYEFANDETALAATNAETHRIALEVAASHSDVLLAQKAMTRLETLDKPSVKDFVNALASCEHCLKTNADTSFAVDLVHRLEKTKKNKNVEVANGRGLMNVLSQLLSRDLEKQQLLCIYDTSKRFRGATHEMEWNKWLSKDARAAILPILGELDDHPDREEETKAVFEALQLTPESLPGYAKASSDFWTEIFHRCVEASIKDDNMYKVAKQILSENYPLNKNVRAMKARVELIWVMSGIRSEIPPEAAIKQVDEILDSCSFDQENIPETGPLLIQGTIVLMLLYGLEGDTVALDDRCTTALGLGLSDVQIFELLRARMEALDRAYRELGDPDQVSELLFPKELGKAERVTFPLPVTEGLLKGVELLDSIGSFVSSKKRGSSALKEWMQQAILCDESTGETTYTDMFLTFYHKMIEEVWRNADGMTLLLSDEFPTARPAPSNPTKFDELKGRLWGDECRQVLLDAMKKGDCEEGWMLQTRGDVEMMADCVAGLYSTPIFNHKSIRAQYKQVRKQSVKRIVELMFERQLTTTKAKILQKFGRKTKKSGRVAHDFATWSNAVEELLPKLWPSLMLTLVFRDRETDARNTEALSIAHNVLVTHPIVKSCDRKVLMSFIEKVEKGGDPILMEAWAAFENLED